MYKAPIYKSYEHLKIIQSLNEDHPEVLVAKPSVCPKCGCTEVQTAFGYDVNKVCLYTDKVDSSQVYWTSFGRIDVIDRTAKDNNCIYRIEVSKQPYKAYFSCETNSCYISDMPIKHNRNVY